jgi:RNA polymerase sigma-70 factor (ECF subfamily)
MDADEVLYRRVKEGNMGAFDALYARHAPRLFGFLRAQLPSPADAEEVMHEAMMRAFESDEVTFDRACFRTWLYRIARNAALNRIRSIGRRARALEGIPPEPPAPPADEQLAHAEMMRALDVAVARLPVPLADVYHLRSSGLSYEEMADVLEIPIGTLKSRMHQMVGALRQELQPWTAR